MRSEEQIAAAADLAQAKGFYAQFRADRDDLSRQPARHVKALTSAINSGSSSQASTCRRKIRNVESRLRQIDRMIEGLERRFPV